MARSEKVCEFVGSRIVDFVAGDIGKGESHRIGRHLTECDRCRSLAREVQRGWQLLGVVPGLDSSKTLHPTQRMNRAAHSKFGNPAIGSGPPKAALPLDSLRVGEWSVRGIENVYPISTFDLVVEFMDSEGALSYVSLINEGDQGFQFNTEGWLEAAGAESSIQHTSGRLVFSDGRADPFEFMELGSGRFVFRCPSFPEGLVPLRLLLLEGSNR